MEKISSAAFTDTKPHYDLLDGLRGVAALIVIWYHVFEGFAFASAGNIETLNHGYLAVDFFFILSGLLSVMRMMTVGEEFHYERLFQTPFDPSSSDGNYGCCFGSYYVLYSGLCAMGWNACRYFHDYVVFTLYNILYSCHAGCGI